MWLFWRKITELKLEITYKHSANNLKENTRLIQLLPKFIKWVKLMILIVDCFALFVCLLSGRTPKGEVGIPWPQSLEFSLTSEGLAFSNALFPGQAWGTNLVLLPYAGGQPNTTPAVI